MKIFITGGTGTIGRNLIKKLLLRGDIITVLTRNKKSADETFIDSVKVIEGNPSELGDWQKEIEGQDAVINLSGEPIVSKSRWTEKIKNEIYNSRINTTKNIISAINNSNNKPKVLINGSAIGFYGFQKDNRKIDESETSGRDFLAKLCLDWEDESRKADKNTRVVRIRTGIVLSENGGALEQMVKPFYMYSGGYIGSGEQWISWIHMDDEVGIIIFALDNQDVKGAINLTSPTPLKMKDFSYLIGKTLHRPNWLNVPKVALKTALGELADVVAEGQRVIPKKALDNGYEFEYSDPEKALKNLLI